MNITVFGDSIARGIIYNERKSRYTISRDSFVERMRKRGIHLRNYSRMGFSSLRGKQTLDRHLAELCDADYTLLEYGGNDCDLNWQEISENPFALHKATVSLDRFRSVITSMIQTVRQAGSTPVLMTLRTLSDHHTHIPLHVPESCQVSYPIVRKLTTECGKPRSSARGNKSYRFSPPCQFHAFRYRNIQKVRWHISGRVCPSLFRLRVCFLLIPYVLIFSINIAYLSNILAFWNIYREENKN